MNVISSQMPLNPGATNMRPVFASIVSDLADKIINVETGKRIYVGGVRLEDPEPELSIDLGYCKINMRVANANLNILIPSSIVPSITNDVVKYLINSLSVELTRRDAELGLDTYVSRDMIFGRCECEYIPAASSFRTNNESIRMIKRAFEYRISNHARKNTRSAAFIWKINTDFNQTQSQKDNWFSDHADIHVDLIGLNLTRMSYDILNSAQSVINYYGCDKIISYKRGSVAGEPFCLSDTERKPIDRLPDVQFESMAYDDYCKLKNNGICIEFPENVPRAQAFFEAFRGGIYNIGKYNQCQICTRRPYMPFYTIKSQSDDSAYATICYRCFNETPMFADLSKSFRIFHINHAHSAISFSQVSSDYGIPPEHVELLECANSSGSQLARDDTIFASRSYLFQPVRYIENLVQYIDDMKTNGTPVTIIMLE